MLFYYKEIKCLKTMKIIKLNISNQIQIQLIHCSWMKWTFRIKNGAKSSHLILNGGEHWTNDQIKIELDDVYQDNALSLSTVKYWTKEFKQRSANLENEQWTRKPQLIKKNPYIIAHNISKKLRILIHTVIQALTDELGYNYSHLRWIHHLLTIETN